MGWKFSSVAPVSVQLASRLKREILSGKYAAGSQFPTVRQLAYEAAVNPNTVQKALAVLEAEGLLESRGTVGRFVTSQSTVIEDAAESALYELMRETLKSARELGVSTEKLIKFIEKEGK